MDGWMHGCMDGSGKARHGMNDSFGIRWRAGHFSAFPGKEGTFPSHKRPNSNERGRDGGKEGAVAFLYLLCTSVCLSVWLSVCLSGWLYLLPLFRLPPECPPARPPCFPEQLAWLAALTMLGVCLSAACMCGDCVGGHSVVCLSGLLTCSNCSLFAVYMCVVRPLAYLSLYLFNCRGFLCVCVYLVYRVGIWVWCVLDGVGVGR